MIVVDKNEISPSEVGCFPDLDALWSTFPRSTRLHMERVGKYADAMYQYMADADLENINDSLGEAFRPVSRQVFMLHDIGRHYIPFELLNKVEDLTREELQLIKDHTVNAKRAIKSIYKQPFSDEIMKIWEDTAVFHHERFDGKGYPYQLTGVEIPLVARICAIADTYDGITSWKPYKKKQTTREEALKIIGEEAGGQFQPELVDIFKRCIVRV
ncbi:hypothetical protein C819_03936 [Lachnospiraceae bacterium 10-1]|nr:hypothetical protein C819_03936 [Lachnospiraceae bacterium 10-1]